jgi:Asp-tRNA(Asn)/Glu-tRNA(Gln) amidotransferase B subunit
MSKTLEYWTVVLDDKRGGKDYYYFSHHDLVMSSIEETWSQKRKLIAITETPGHILVHSKEDGSLLLAAALTGPITILDGPIHF